MKLANVEDVKKLRDSGPRKKDKAGWGISNRDINSSNYNMWFASMTNIIKWLENRKK